MPEFVLREFNYPTDYAPALALWSSAGPGVRVGRSDAPEEIVKKLHRDPDLFLVAEQAGELIGTVIGGFDGRRGVIYHLAVQPGARSQGVGQALMDAVEERLRGKGCLRCYLLVTLDNEPAMAFYEKRGWNRMQIITYGKDLA